MSGASIMIHNGKSGELLEEYWDERWAEVEEDFGEMRSLGVNVVRIHLQLPHFMKSATAANQQSLKRLKALITLAEKNQLYLDLTGLGCYHKATVPQWYDELSEAERWEVQALFWKEVATVCKDSPAIFCYDLMNEPVLPGKSKVETEWLTGELGGKHFVQRISLDLQGRTREEVALAWVKKMTSAIRSVDQKHLITVA